MKNFFNKIFTPEVSLVFLIALALFGVFEYVEYRLNLISGKIGTEINVLNTKVATLENTVNGTKSNLTNVLLEEQASNNSLASQVSEVTNTVGALSKLSKIDPELLKKYSKTYFLNENYVPLSLSDVNPAFTSGTSKNYQVESSVLPFLTKMIDAGNGVGVSLLVQSAYRSFGTQSTLKASYRVIYGAGTANSFSADQGYSEHQLGTAVDFTTKKTNGALEGFDKTPEYAWLTENAYQYGFVISYPAGNKYYKYEPWHWRFVGIALATYLHDDNLHFYDLDQRLIDNYLGNLFDS